MVAETSTIFRPGREPGASTHAFHSREGTRLESDVVRVAGKALTVSTAAAGPVSVRQDRRTGKRGENRTGNEPPLAPETGRSLSTADNQ